MVLRFYPSMVADDWGPNWLCNIFWGLLKSPMKQTWEIRSCACDWSLWVKMFNGIIPNLTRSDK
jgi:hypothetical protein